MMGMVHAAMFDAVNSIERRYRPYRAKSWMRDLRGGKYADTMDIACQQRLD